MNCPDNTSLIFYCDSVLTHFRDMIFIQTEYKRRVIADSLFASLIKNTVKHSRNILQDALNNCLN